MRRTQKSKRQTRQKRAPELSKEETRPEQEPIDPKQARLWRIALVGFLGVCVLMMVSCFAVSRMEFDGMAVGASCITSSDMLQSSLVAYARQNGRFPDADTWLSDIRPFYERVYDAYEQDFEQEGKWYLQLKPVQPGDPPVCDFLEGRSHLTFNSELAGQSLEEIEDPAETVLLFETEEPSENFSMPYEPQPENQAPRVMRVTREWIIEYVQEEELEGAFSYTPEDALPEVAAPNGP